MLIPEEVLIYDENEVKLRASGQAILTGLRFKTRGLWRVTLKFKVKTKMYIPYESTSQTPVDILTTSMRHPARNNKLITYTHVLVSKKRQHGSKPPG